MCCSDSETSDHLFVDCNYAQKVWSLTLHGFNVSSLESVPSPEKIPLVTLFSNWKTIYPHLSQGKSAWSKIWVEIPKYVCWNIWLARNEKIFNNTQHLHLKVAAKSKALLIETVGIQTFKKRYSLLLEEKNGWAFTLLEIEKRNLPDPA